MAPASCALDEAGLDAQLARYRAVGKGARVLARSPRRAVIGVSARVSERVVEQLLAVERACCPFFELAWEARTRRLTVAVPSAQHEPALEAVLGALGAQGAQGAPEAGRPLENPLHTSVIGDSPPARKP